MVGMAVREHDVGHAPDRRRLVGHKRGVAGKERIDQHSLAGEIKPEGGVTIPGDLHDSGPCLGVGRIGRPEDTPPDAKINAPTAVSAGLTWFDLAWLGL